MSRQTKLLGAWLITGGLALLFIGMGPAGEVISGLILTSWGAGIGLNYRGAADAMPGRFMWTKWSTARYRFTFAFFGLVGVLLLVAGLYRLRR